MIKYYTDLIQGQKMVTIDRERLMVALHYNEITGVFTWRNPPNNHQRLLGTVAGGKKTGYLMIKIDGQKFKAHRLAWLYEHGIMPDCIIDHRDGDPFNNAISNLRLATQAQNCANSKQIAGKELPKGVRKNGSGYTARISFGKKMTTIGTFPTVHEAATAYLREAKRLYGEFARAA